MNWKLYNDYEKNSGNLTTINRLSILLKLEITNKIEDNIIGIHIIKFGLKVYDKNINYGLIVGGTDIYEELNSLYNRKYVLDNAKFIVVFNQYMLNRVLTLTNNQNVFEIKQSFIPIKINKTPNLLLKVHKERPFKKVYLFIGNLRKIKDPFYLKNVFDYLYEKYKYLLVIIGNNDNYDKSLFTNGYYYLGSLDYKLALIQLLYCDGLINSSINEGMSSAIIEALYYKVPVFARENEGNSAFKNIIIYNSPDHLMNILMYNFNYNQIINNGRIEYILNHHPLTEKFKYETILSLI
jgi:hypothetical protein